MLGTGRTVDRLEQNYQILQFLDESTDEYLFVADLLEERIRIVLV